MITLRWILAFPIAALAWLYFPFLCSFVISQNPGTIATAVVCFLNPIISLGVFLLVSPSGNRSNLVAGVAVYSVICTIGTLLVSFDLLIGGGPHPFEVLIFEILGTIMAVILAYACIPLKCDGLRKK